MKYFHCIKPMVLNRFVILFFWLVVLVISYLLAERFKDPNLFAASGAIGTMFGMLLNIKYGLLTYSDKTDVELYNQINGAAQFGTLQLGDKQRKELKDKVHDEIFGLSFMILGTIVWGYGGYIVILPK